MSAKLQTVHVRVNDAATGQPTPCRVRFTDAEGRYYAPYGRLTEFATAPGEDVGGNLLLGDKAFAYIYGTCEIDLPSGQLFVDVHKGPEYEPLFRELNVSPGKLAVRLALKRWTNLNEEGWYSGDTRAHWISSAAALLEGMAEDLAVTNVLAAHNAIQTQRSFPNILEFSGQRPALELPGHIVVVNTLNRHPVLGDLALLNCHRIVYPLYFGEPVCDDNWALADWCDQCHRKGGLTIWAKAQLERAQVTGYGWAGEALADLILGKVDAFEIFCPLDAPLDDMLREWYRLQSCGFRVPLVGASGKEGNNRPLGTMRTYAHINAGEEFNYPNWIEAIRAGRTFITNGPILSFSVDGEGPGEIIRIASSSRSMNLRAEARGISPFERLEIVMDGEVIASALPSGSPFTAIVEQSVSIAFDCWVAARCWGSERLPTEEDELGNCIYAHTSPVYIEVGRPPARPSAEIIAPLLTELNQAERWLEEIARCDDKHCERFADIFRRARQELLKRAAV